MEFVQIWMVALVSLVVTSTVTVLFVLVTTGVIQDMSPNERGELRSFSMIVMGAWSMGISLIVAQVIVLLA